MPVDLRAHPIPGQDAGLAATLIAAGLPIEEMGEGGRRFHRFDDSGNGVGHGGFEPHREYALVRSIVVLPALIGEGYRIPLNRLFVATPLATQLCRPSEVVFDILENAGMGPFTKEDGEVVFDSEGKRHV